MLVDTKTNFSAKDILDKYTSIPQSVLDIESLGDTCTLAKNTNVKSNTKQTSGLKTPLEGQDTPTIIVSKLPREHPIPKPPRKAISKEVPKYPLVTRNISKLHKEKDANKKSSVKIIKTTSRSASSIAEPAKPSLGQKNMYSGPKILVIKRDDRPKDVSHKKNPTSQKKTPQSSSGKSSISLNRLETILDLTQSESIQHSKNTIGKSIPELSVQKGRGDVVKSSHSKSSSSVQKDNPSGKKEVSSEKNKGKFLKDIRSVQKGNGSVQKGNGSVQKGNGSVQKGNSSLTAQSNKTRSIKKSEKKTQKNKSKNKQKPIKKKLSSIKPSPVLKPNTSFFKRKTKSVSTSRPSRWEMKSKKSNHKHNNDTILEVYQLIPPQSKPIFTDNIKTKIDFLQQELSLTNSRNRPDSLIHRLFEMVQDPLFDFET